jgi:phosphate:Na+ symporter
MADHLHRAVHREEQEPRVVAVRTERLLARLRRGVLLREHAGLVAPSSVFEITDALRWLERVAFHLERIAHYAALAAGNGVEEDPAVRDSRREP